MEEKPRELKKVLLPDGVHVSNEGSKNFALNIKDSIKLVQEGTEEVSCLDSAAVHVSGVSRYFWRGFTSPNGSRSQPVTPGWAKSSKIWSHKQYGPYTGRWSKDRKKW